jgi:hypothetical protein
MTSSHLSSSFFIHSTKYTFRPHILHLMPTPTRVPGFIAVSDPASPGLLDGSVGSSPDSDLLPEGTGAPTHDFTNASTLVFAPESSTVAPEPAAPTAPPRTRLHDGIKKPSYTMMVVYASMMVLYATLSCLLLVNCIICRRLSRFYIGRRMISMLHL